MGWCAVEYRRARRGVRVLRAAFRPGHAGLTALLCGLVWFVIILNLDRLLVVTLNTAAGWQAFWVAMPRFLMAAVIGTIVATSLTLQIFHQEIEAELQNMHAELIIENQRQLDKASKQMKTCGSRRRTCRTRSRAGTPPRCRRIRT